MKKFTPKHIAYYALLIAINVILSRLGSIRIGAGGVEFVRIGLGGLPVVFAGIVFGPVAGGVVGGVADLIGMLVSPMGGYMPHFTLIAALNGIIPGIIMIKCKDRECRSSFWKLSLAIGAGLILSSTILWSYFMNTLFGMPLATILPGRIISNLVNIPLFAYIIKTLVNRLPMVSNLN